MIILFELSPGPTGYLAATDLAGRTAEMSERRSATRLVRPTRSSNRVLHGCARPRSISAAP